MEYPNLRSSPYPSPYRGRGDAIKISHYLNTKLGHQSKTDSEIIIRQMEDKQKKNDKILISLLASWVRVMKKPFLVRGVNVSYTFPVELSILKRSIILPAKELPIKFNCF